jgi:transcription-repair coupling factor (superfamily II helicase)
MDRLLSGDVGFGKTEVSLHAVYRAFLNEKQTIFLAPLRRACLRAFRIYPRTTEALWCECGDDDAYEQQKKLMKSLNVTERWLDSLCDWDASAPFTRYKI